MSTTFAVSVTLILAAGLTAVVLVALRWYVRPIPWVRLLASLFPIALVAGAVLVLGSSNG